MSRIIEKNTNKTNDAFMAYYNTLETNILKDFVYINTIKANYKHKSLNAYNIIDGYKYTIIIKKKKKNYFSKNIKLIIATIDHPYIIKLIQFNETTSSYISVFEYFKDISLYSSVILGAKYDEAKIKNIIYQIMLTIHYLHSNNLAHRKLTPYSFLIKTIKNELMIKLVDYFKITFITSKISLQIKSINVYQIGVIMYFLVYNKFPPVSYQYNLKTNFNDNIWKNYSLKGRNFIKKILFSDLSSMMSIKEALEHDWFKEDIKANIYINFDIIKKIYDFWKLNTFKRYILNSIAKFIIKEDIYYYNYIFFYFDVLKEGSIKYEQYFKVMKNLGLIDANIQESFNGLDIFKIGQIKYSNFVACLLNKFIKIDKRIVFNFFKKLDYNNEGLINKEKLYKFYNIKIKSDLGSETKKKFNFSEFFNYICKE